MKPVGTILTPADPAWARAAAGILHEPGAGPGGRWRAIAKLSVRVSPDTAAGTITGVPLLPAQRQKWCSREQTLENLLQPVSCAA
jgi:hypothetical protein